MSFSKSSEMIQLFICKENFSKISHEGGVQGNRNFHSFYIFSICVASLKSPASSSLGSTATSSEPPESEDELLDAELRRSICSSIYAALCQGDSRRTTPTRQCCILIEEMGISRRGRPLLLTDRQVHML